MRKRYLLGMVTAVLATSVTATAQFEQPHDIPVAFAYDTGTAYNQSDAAAVILSFTVKQAGATSLRLYFDTVQMDPQATLRMVSVYDGATQTLNPVQVEEWHHSSAYFNGDEVIVEMIAPPQSGPHRLVLSSLDMGVPPFFPETICDADDRILSSDPRSARLLPIGCTAWLTDDCGKCFFTAGHCTGAATTVQFNVPLSLPNGALQHPGPEDQYSVDNASLQTNGGLGVGNDWGYFGVFRNATTGMTPYEAQGSTAFAITNPPPVGGGNTIRITGYGVDSTPPQNNQVQQTNAGPLVTSAGTTVQYRTDTEGGNSGSPVIWEQTGQAVGIHTHGGCFAGGGANSGTGINHAGVQAALANPQGVCDPQRGGPFLSLGNGLAGTNGIPALSGNGTLAAGAPYNLDLVSARANSLTLIVLGFTRLNAPFVGGTMVPALDLLVTLTTNGAGQIHIAGNWPGTPACTYLYFQFWVLDPLAVKNFAASNGILGISP